MGGGGGGGGLLSRLDQGFGWLIRIDWFKKGTVITPCVAMVIIHGD